MEDNATAQPAQQQIRIRHAELTKKAQDLRRQMDHVAIDLKHLQADCDHPNAYNTTCTGESWSS